ncbi:MAG: hypothetical protein ABI082_02545 [Dokdonella sp.]
MRLKLSQLLIAPPDTREEGLRLLAQAVTLREKFLDGDDPLIVQSRVTLRLARQSH